MWERSVSAPVNVTAGRPGRDELPAAELELVRLDPQFHYRWPNGSELDVALAIERINENTTLGIRSVNSAWAGLRTFAPDRTPVVGRDPSEPDGCAHIRGPAIAPCRSIPD